MWLRVTHRRRWVVTTSASGIALGCALSLAWVSPTSSADVSMSGDRQEPKRLDCGDLTVLDVYGTYAEMGQQQVELLGEEARRQFQVQFDAYRRNTSHIGRVIDWILPIGAWIASMVDDSGLIEESRGFAAGLGVTGSDGLRFLLGSLPSGSTSFAATRSATGDGGPIIGRNTDWPDDDGRLRPIVIRHHPSNGDLAHMTAGWALAGSGALGLNEAGFAMSFNWFPGAYSGIGGIAIPAWPNRRVLQQARTVEDGIRIFRAATHRGLPGFFTMADAAGDIAMVECTTEDCAVFRPDRDWFSVANHAQTAEMTAIDSVRTPDSFRRLAAMDHAVQAKLGGIDAMSAAQILRDRSNSEYINDSVVANPMVFNAAVIQPNTGALWHSIRRQPLAPFGKMVAITFGSTCEDALEAGAQPPESQLSHEAELIARLRQAELLFEKGKTADSERAYDELDALSEEVLEPNRLMWARARTKWTLGNLADADSLLTRLDHAKAPFEVRVWALAMRGVIADWEERREEASGHYRRANALLASSPEYRLPDVANLIDAGSRGSRASADNPPTPDLQYALRYPGSLGPAIPRVRMGTSRGDGGDDPYGPSASRLFVRVVPASP
jgi:hypothetical protein